MKIASDFMGREYEVDYRQPPSMHLYAIEVQGPQIKQTRKDTIHSQHKK